MDLFPATPFLSIDQILSHGAPDQGMLQTTVLLKLPVPKKKRKKVNNLHLCHCVREEKFGHVRPWRYRKDTAISSSSKSLWSTSKEYSHIIFNFETHLVIWPGSIKVNLHPMLQSFQSFFLKIFKQMFHIWENQEHCLCQNEENLKNTKLWILW